MSPASQPTITATSWTASWSWPGYRCIATGSEAQVAAPATTAAVSDHGRRPRPAAVKTAIARFGPALLTNGVNATSARAAAT